MQLLHGYRPYLALALLCLALYLPGLAAVPPLDRDESRFAQATRQMLESDDFVRIQFQDDIRAKKPVGAYWAQAASVAALTDPAKPAIWAHRLPSALAALAATLMTFAFGRHLFDRRTAFLGAMLLGSSLMLVTEAHQAKTDAIMLACVVAAQGALARFWMAGQGRPAPGAGVALTFWIAQGIGILVKGPIVPVITILTALSLSVAKKQKGWLAGMRPITGVLICAAIVAPWTMAISSATDGQFLGKAISEDLLPKLLGAQESHGAPPLYYLALASITFWPASLFLWPSLVHAWKTRKDAAIGFLLAWIVPAWIVFELVPTKLPHYTLPTYPALALLVAAAIIAGSDALKARGAKIWYGVWAVIGLAFAAAFAILPFIYGDGFNPWSLIASPAAAAAGLVPLWLAWKGRLPLAATAMVAAAGLVFIAVFQGIMPGLSQLAVAPRLAEVVNKVGREGPIASAGFSEPSLVFLMGTNTVFTSGSGAAGHLMTYPRSVVAVEQKELDDFRQASARSGQVTHEIAVIDGLNYSRGKKVVMHVFVSGQ